MEFIVLKNGEEELDVLVGVTMASLESLIQDNPTAFHEFVVSCRDDKNRLAGSTLNFLKGLGLVQEDGTIDDSVRNVVLSAVEGDGLAMKLVSPSKVS